MNWAIHALPVCLSTKLCPNYVLASTSRIIKPFFTPQPLIHSCILYPSRKFGKLSFDVSSRSFLGGNLGKSVSDLLKVETAGEIRSFSIEELQKNFGNDNGEWLFKICRGICDSPVSVCDSTKSMMAAKTMHPPVKDLKGLSQWASILAAELFTRLHEDHELNQRWPKTLTVSCKSTSLSTPKSKAVAMPKRAFISSHAEIKSIIDTLLLSNATFTSNIFPCERFSITCSTFEEDTCNAQEVDSMKRWLMPSTSISIPSSKSCTDVSREERLSKSSMRPVSASASSKKRKSSLLIRDIWRKQPHSPHSEETADPHILSAWTPSPPPTSSNTDKLQPPTPLSFSDHVLIYQCSRCDQPLFRDDPKSIQEHEDWHFALTLSTSTPPRSISSPK